MNTAKKLLASAVVLLSLSSAPAFANELNIELNLGEPAPVYVPPPVVYTPSPAYIVAPWGETYDPHHRRHDWEYWHHHHDHDEHWEHERWEHEHGDHDHDHWDHDRR
jgi:hypothetical protein